MRERATSPVAPTDVLYVDSDSDFAALVERSLTRLDPTVSVDHVTSADAAFEAISDGVDCVVSAYTLRETDAVSFLREFRKEYPDLPFVLFTGAGSETVAADAIAAGVSAYVPVRAGENNFELLAQRIWTVTQGYRATQRAESASAELRKAYQRTEEAVVAVDPEWRIIFSNDNFSDRVGVDRERLGGHSLWEVAAELDTEEFRDTAETVIDSRDPETVETTLADGSRLSARLFPDEEGGVICYLQDVTERRRRERHAAILRAVADGVDTAALVLDDDLGVKFANDSAKRILGVDGTPDESDLDEALDGDSAERVASAVGTALGRVRGDGGVERQSCATAGHGADSHGPPAGPETDSVERVDETRTVEAVDVRGLDESVAVQIEPFTVESDPHALLTADIDADDVGGDGSWRETASDEGVTNSDDTEDGSRRSLDRVE